MQNKPKPLSGKRVAPGPKPEVLRIKGNWQDAVKQSLQKKKPANGWPK